MVKRIKLRYSAEGEYVVIMRFGQKGQVQCRMVIDTGSSDLWVLQRAMGIQDLHYPHGIQRLPNNVPTFRVDYAEGSEYSSYICRGRVILDDYRADNQAFGIVEVRVGGPNIPKFTQDGLIGLGFSGNRMMPLIHGPNFLENAVDSAAGGYTRMLFTVKIPSNRIRGNNTTANETEIRRDGFMTIGEIDDGYAIGTLGSSIWYAHIKPLANKRNHRETWGEWAFDSSFICIESRGANGEIQRTKRETKDNYAIADTGSASMYIQAHICKEFYDMIPGSDYDETSRQWKIPADTDFKNAPRLGIAVGKYLIWIAPEDYFVEGEEGDKELVGAIQPRGADDEEDLLGAPFLKNVYGVFDFYYPRFGVAQVPHPDGKGHAQLNEGYPSIGAEQSDQPERWLLYGHMD